MIVLNDATFAQYGVNTAPPVYIKRFLFFAIVFKTQETITHLLSSFTQLFPYTLCQVIWAFQTDFSLLNLPVSDQPVSPLSLWIRFSVCREQVSVCMIPLPRISSLGFRGGDYGSEGPFSWTLGRLGFISISCCNLSVICSGELCSMMFSIDIVSAVAIWNWVRFPSVTGSSEVKLMFFPI